MNSIPGPLFSFFTFSTLLLSTAPSAFPSRHSDAREVHIASVQGEVRLSRGDGKHMDLKKPWE
jgi:hypothetical protein